MIPQKRASGMSARAASGTRSRSAAMAMVWAAAACAPGKEPHSPPEAKDAGADIGEHCAALVSARVYSPGCNQGAPQRDAGLPGAPDAAKADAGGPSPDAAAPPPEPTGAGLDAGPSAAPDAGGTPGPANDCCTPSSEPGCNDPAVLSCVCEGDEFCCSDTYDAVCVTQAASRCELDCDERPPVSDCCAPSDVPSCSLPSVAACVCEEDPFCCVFRFDENCVNLASARCAAGCMPEVSP